MHIRTFVREDELEQSKKETQNYHMDDQDLYLSDEHKSYDGYDVLALPKMTLELERHASEAFFIPGDHSFFPLLLFYS